MKRILHTVAPFALAVAVSVAGVAPTLQAQAMGDTAMRTTGTMDTERDDDGFDLGWLGLLGLLGLLGMRKRDHVHTTHDTTTGAPRRP